MNVIKQIVIIFLSLVTLSYSGGIAIAKHYCKDKLVSKAVNAEVKKCKKEASAQPFNGETEFHKSSCCSTDYSFFKSFDFENLNTEAQSNTPAKIATYAERPIVSVRKIFIETRQKKPPLPRLPIYMVVESYLI